MVYSFHHSAEWDISPDREPFLMLGFARPCGFCFSNNNNKGGCLLHF